MCLCCWQSGYGVLCVWLRHRLLMYRLLLELLLLHGLLLRRLLLRLWRCERVRWEAHLRRGRRLWWCILHDEVVRNALLHKLLVVV